ncbi:hypothetical protein MNEG_5504 [Monoraphidium neglectum]|uniref:Uncharacterized protein n=1 Tax=Monoraphidium neglectum TaxID=145388 RepID=A0A0D2JU69_9CHLO|nr:hypothetical protein MNEG_5504 [Monoraphidium neglectum]KIZ02453.1 hypothetical protein MNEG_5504 [Monoraphidium neglectum]|eukprot:XP_013901472.1 hypothetical protein MNEG_5504 [Monoraphidium neglectum]
MVAPPRPCLMTLLEAGWYGPRSRPSAGGPSPTALAKAWYANGAATGSSPSLYQEDELPEGGVSALLPGQPPPGRSDLPRPPQLPPPQLPPLDGCGAAAWDAGRQGAAAGARWQEERCQGIPHLQPEGVGLYRPSPQQPPHHQQQQRQQLQVEEEQAQQGAPIPVRGGGECSTSGRGEGDQQQAGLGTWAHRQFKLPLPGRGGKGNSKQQQEQEQQQRLEQREDEAQHAACAAAVPLGSSVAQPIPRGRQPPGSAAAPPQAAAGGGGRADDDDEAYTRAAWRWRFAKRWQAEQARQLDPAASGGDGDGLEEALAYLAACGQPWDMPRTLSGDGALGASGFSGAGGALAAAAAGRGGGGDMGTMGSVGLLGQESLLVGGDLSRGASLTNVSPGRRSALAGGGPSGAGRGGGRGGGGGRHGDATRELTAVTRRATQLLQAQTDLGRAADERWREAQAPQGGGLWVGALLEAVEVDDWGKFKFVLVRVRDRCGRQKLLVRGGNYASEGKLLERLHRQLLAAASAHGVPPEPLEPIGGGVMEWRRERDRHLHLHSGFLSKHAGGQGGPMTAQEVLNLAGVLTRPSLPMHYKLTSEGGRAL